MTKQADIEFPALLWNLQVGLMTQQTKALAPLYQCAMGQQE